MSEQQTTSSTKDDTNSLTENVSSNRAEGASQSLELENILTKITRFTSPSQRQSIKFLASSFIPSGRLENMNIILDMFTEIEDVYTRVKAAEIFKIILSHINFNKKLIVELEEYMEHEFRQQLPIEIDEDVMTKLSFHAQLLQLIDIDEFDNHANLRQLVAEFDEERQLGTSRANIDSPVKLLQQLVHVGTIAFENVDESCTLIREKIVKARDERQREMHIKRKKIYAVSLVVVGVVTLLIIFSVPFLITHSVCNFSKSLTLGLDNDTVLLSDSVMPFCYEQVNISQITKEGDALHDITVYLVDPDSLVIGNLKVTFNSAQINQRYVSSKTGLVEYLYLVEGSVIHYTICVGSEGDRNSQDGEIFVFDNVDNYLSYLKSLTSRNIRSVYSHAISIGTDNHFECTSLHYQALRPSYYFIASRTQGGIFYTFNYTVDARYYDPMNYTSKCMIRTGDTQKSCDLAVPHTANKFIVIAHIVPAEDVTFPQTHLYLAGGRPGSGAKSMYAVFGIICVFIIIVPLIIITSIKICTFSSCKPTLRGYGYDPVKLDDFS